MRYDNKINTKHCTKHLFLFDEKYFWKKKENQNFTKWKNRKCWSYLLNHNHMLRIDNTILQCSTLGLTWWMTNNIIIILNSESPYSVLSASPCPYMRFLSLHLSPYSSKLVFWKLMAFSVAKNRKILTPRTAFSTSDYFPFYSQLVPIFRNTLASDRFGLNVLRRVLSLRGKNQNLSWKKWNPNFISGVAFGK